MMTVTVQVDKLVQWIGDMKVQAKALNSHLLLLVHHFFNRLGQLSCYVNSFTFGFLGGSFKASVTVWTDWTPVHYRRP